MNKIEKLKALSLKKADASADIGLINKYTQKELTPEEVYCFSVILCDNDVDRDMERFTKASLEALAPLFLGKSGISDHHWSAEKQIARLYRTATEDTGEKNALGEPKTILRGDAYMLRTDKNAEFIAAIDGGIIKEVSVGCAVGKCSCSVCGEDQKLDYRSWSYQCKNGHIKGETYDKKLCVGELSEPKDAYEFSFVAVPAQRGAGVTKSAGDIEEAFVTLMEADLSGYSANIKSLIPHFQKILTDSAEREKRAEILEENQKYLMKKE